MDIDLQAALDRYDKWVDPPDETDISTFVLAARLVANAVPVVMTSRFVREYAVTANPTEADAWLIDPPGDTK